MNDQWLTHCREEGRFLPSEGYLVKDRTAERQHKFSLSKSVTVVSVCFNDSLYVSVLYI